MKDEEILKRAIEKAIKGGFHFKEWFTARFGLPYWPFDEQIDMLTKTENKMLLLFNHSFAEAFWGKGLVCLDCGDTIKICREELANACGYEGTGNKGIAYEYHLQQIVLEEDKLKYLERFL